MRVIHPNSTYLCTMCVCKACLSYSNLVHNHPIIIRVVRSFFGAPNRGYPSNTANWFACLGRLAEATHHGLQRASIAVSRVRNLAGGLRAISHSCPSGHLYVDKGMSYVATLWADFLTLGGFLAARIVCACYTVASSLRLHSALMWVLMYVHFVHNCKTRTPFAPYTKKSNSDQKSTQCM